VSKGETILQKSYDIWRSYGQEYKWHLLWITAAVFAPTCRRVFKNKLQPQNSIKSCTQKTLISYVHNILYLHVIVCCTWWNHLLHGNNVQIFGILIFSAFFILKISTTTIMWLILVTLYGAIVFCSYYHSYILFSHYLAIQPFQGCKCVLIKSIVGHISPPKS